jgi:NADH:ubiquinone reductase (H+-translocating)
MSAKIPPSKNPRIVIIGAGFAGLRLAKKLANKAFQVVVIDRNNFHQFQPLFYQVATAGLAPSAIAFPLRKALQHSPNVHFRMASVENISLDDKTIQTDIGPITYDQLVIAVGADTNYFNNKEIEANAYPMKSVQESLTLRNRILECLETAMVTEDEQEQEANMHIVVVGGGPTGTEVSGALSEMKRYVLPSDYPELNFSKMRIFLIEASGQLLNGMSPKSSAEAQEFLTEMGVEVKLNTLVESYDGKTVKTKDGTAIETKTLIWAAGVKGNRLAGIPDEYYVANSRIKVNAFNQLIEYPEVFALGDIALLQEEKVFERGHPQVAQVAIQQADNLAKNLLSGFKNPKPFHYSDLGSMATVGRSKAVVDLPGFHFKGFFAWVFWLFVHLMAILGVKNKFFIFIDWLWYYLSFDQSLRLVIRQKPKN